MNKEQIEALTRWMEKSNEQQIALQARIMATNLVLSSVMSRLPDSAALLEDLLQLQASLRSPGSGDPKTSELVAGFLQAPIEDLQG